AGRGVGPPPARRDARHLLRERSRAVPPPAPRRRASQGLRSVDFQPTAEKLIPDLTPAEELVILARTLWREGYDDHLAGHITYKQPDGTLLCNPWYLLWSQVRPEQVIRIDLEGNVLEGDWPAPLGIPLHLELHKRRDVEVAVHSHPRYGTIWADAGRIPPVFDQSSALGGGRLVLVDEY